MKFIEQVMDTLIENDAKHDRMAKQNKKTRRMIQGRMNHGAEQSMKNRKKMKKHFDTIRGGKKW
jgi:hypothetical protein